MTIQDRIDTLQTTAGFLRTYRNLNRNRQEMGKAEAAERELARIRFEVDQLKKEEAKHEAA